MTLIETDNPGTKEAEKPEELSFADKFDAKARELAKSLDKSGRIYACFAVIDSASLTLSNAQYLFSLLYTNNDSVLASDALHDWMKSPTGFVITAIEAFALAAFAIIANQKDSLDKKDSYKRYIALLWPYMRDMMKASKNSYKGVRSLVQMANQLGGVNINPFILPLSLALGGLAIGNRAWSRHLKNKRKKLMDINEDVLARVKQKCGLIRMSVDPESLSAEKLSEALQYKPAYILFDSNVYYADCNACLVRLSVCPEELESIFPTDVDKRIKAKKNVHFPLIKSLLNHTPPKVVWTEEQQRELRGLLQEESLLVRSGGYVSAVFGGSVDSLYLYLGLLGVSVLAGPAFVPMAIFCIVQSVSCIMSRVYDEYTAQRNFLINRAAVDLALYLNEKGQIIQTWFAELNQLSKDLAVKNYQPHALESMVARQKELTSLLNTEIQIFTVKRSHFLSLQPTSYFEAIFIGIKNGLSAYSAFASSVFFVATILMMASTPFPPAFLITCVSIGMGLLLGFIALSLIHAYQHHQTLQNKSKSPDVRLSNVMAELKDPVLVHKSRVETVESIIGDGLVVDSSPESSFQSWFEVIRMAFSGPSKGFKLTDLALNDFQQKDVASGHYHDPLFMQLISIIPAIACTIILPLTALARSFSKDKKKAKKTSPDTVSSLKEVSSPSEARMSPFDGSDSDPDNKDDNQAPFSNKLDDSAVPRSHSLPSLANQPHSFFGKSVQKILPFRPFTPALPYTPEINESLAPAVMA